MCKIRCIGWVDPKFGTLISEYESFYGEVYVKVVLKFFDITCQKFHINTVIKGSFIVTHSLTLIAPCSMKISRILPKDMGDVFSSKVVTHPPF